MIARCLRAAATAILALGSAVILAGTATADDVTVVVDIPDGSSELRVTDAQLRWGLNAESGSGAFFGGCNFLSAGAAGDAGSARVWTASDTEGPDALFRTSHGDVRIEKPDGEGGWQRFDWDGRCQDANGRTVTTTGGDLGTGVTAVIEGGEGVVDLEASTVDIQWRGSVTVTFYGGLTYWWFTDPRLIVEPDGTGTLTATIAGFGTSMEDTSIWEPLSPLPGVELATLDEIALGEDGFETLPQFEGVEIAVPDRLQPQRRAAAGWGSFPQSFVDAQVRTGQAAYWYTSGGVRDFAKKPTTLWISYDAATPQQAIPPRPSIPQTGGTAAGPGTGAPGAGAGSSAGSSSGSSSGGGSGSSTRTPPVSTPLATQPALAQPMSIIPTTPTWLTPGLIPTAATGGRGQSDLLAIGFAGVLGMSSIALLGFRGGWLVLPFSKT